MMVTMMQLLTLSDMKVIIDDDISGSYHDSGNNYVVLLCVLWCFCRDVVVALLWYGVVCYVVLCCVMLCYILLCCVMLCCVELDCAQLSCVVLCCLILCCVALCIAVFSVVLCCWL